VISVEVASTLAKFFDGGRGPSHDELTMWFRATGLLSADPGSSGPLGPIGKMKRVRNVLYFAVENDPAAGVRLVNQLVEGLRGSGAFLPGSETYAGDEVIAAGRRAFKDLGYELDPSGHLRPQTLDNLEGAELTEALRAYVRRARSGASDNPHVIGTAKDLTEAVARHVIVERGGRYSETMGFAGTLYQAYDLLGLTLPPSDLMERLEKDPRAAVQQSLYLAVCAVNRLRNAEGTGHGRPQPPKANERDARLSSQISGLVSELLLDLLNS